MRQTVLFFDNEMHGPYDFSIRTVSKVDDPYGSYGSYRTSECALL